MSAIAQPVQANDFANAATDLGGAVSSLFGAQAASASASSYEQAAGIANQNAALVAQQTAIKETQASRQVYKTGSTQTAQIAGAGFATSGSALDIMRSSASEGALNKALIAQTGAISENSYAEQAGAFQGQADAAKSSSTAQTVGGILQGAGGLYKLYNGASKLFNGTTADTVASVGGDWAGSIVEGGIGGWAETGAEVAGAVEGAGILDSFIELGAFL